MILFTLIMSLMTDAIFTEENNRVIGEMVSSALSFLTQPITFSWGRSYTLYFQGAALIVALIAIIVNGIRSNILINGGTEDESAGHYIFRSLWPIAVIAATPTIVGLITSLVSFIINDLMLAATGIDYGRLVKAVVALNTTPVLQIFSIIGMIAVIYYTVTVAFQCIKRQLQLTVLSIIGPAVAATTISENNSGDFITLMKEMIGIGVITALQLSLLISAIAIPAMDAFSGWPGPVQLLVIVGVFAAIKQLPRWIERYTLAPQVSGQGGAGRSVMMAAGFAGRSAIAKAIR